MVPCAWDCWFILVASNGNEVVFLFSFRFPNVRLESFFLANLLINVTLPLSLGCCSSSLTLINYSACGPRRKLQNNLDSFVASFVGDRIRLWPWEPRDAGIQCFKLLFLITSLLSPYVCIDNPVCLLFVLLPFLFQINFCVSRLLVLLLANRSNHQVLQVGTKGEWVRESE